jgi:hypothetical protein
MPIDPRCGEPVYYAPDDAEVREQTFAEREEQILSTVNERVAAAQSVEEIVDFLFEQTRDICPCDRISIAFLEDDDRRVVSHYARTTYEPLAIRKGYAADIADSSLEPILREGRIRIIRDVRAYLVAHPESTSTKLLRREGVESNMTCPLSVDGRRVGFLFRSSRHEDAYGPHEAALHLAVAQRLSQAVEKAWLLRQLRQANENYLEMLGFVSHEIKNPLSTIIMATDVLKDGYLGDLPDAATKKIGTIGDRARYLMSLVGDYLDLARLESGSIDLDAESLDLVEDVLGPAVEMVGPQREERAMDLQEEFAENLPSVEGDADLLKVVFINLLSNAVKYGNEGGRVRLRAWSEDGSIRVSVFNEGPGFSQEERNRLFRKFSRLDKPELRKRKGSGLGLYTSWRFVQLHGGTIRADSKEGEWAEFTVELP